MVKERSHNQILIIVTIVSVVLRNPCDYFKLLLLNTAVPVIIITGLHLVHVVGGISQLPFQTGSKNRPSNSDDYKSICITNTHKCNMCNRHDNT